MKTAKCSKCLKRKPISSFSKNRTLERGISYWCKFCSNKNTVIANNIKAKNNNSHYKYGKSKSYAKSKGIPFLLTEVEYANFIKNKCYYCQISISGHGINLDRINNDKKIGYTLDNVLTCCRFCNLIRNNLLTVEETKIAVEAIMDFRKKKVGL
jgi:hypothetical protein